MEIPTSRGADGWGAVADDEWRLDAPPPPPSRKGRGRQKGGVAQ